MPLFDSAVTCIRILIIRSIRIMIIAYVPILLAFLMGILSYLVAFYHHPLLHRSPFYNFTTDERMLVDSSLASTPPRWATPSVLTLSANVAQLSSWRSCYQ